MIDFVEGHILVVTDIPRDIRIFPSALLVSVRLEDIEQFPHHHRLSHASSPNAALLVKVAQPDLNLALLIDTYLIFIDAEKAGCVGQLRVSVDAGVIDVKDVRIWDVVDVGKSERDSFNEDGS